MDSDTERINFIIRHAPLYEDDKNIEDYMEAISDLKSIAWSKPEQAYYTLSLINKTYPSATQKEVVELALKKIEYKPKVTLLMMGDFNPYYLLSNGFYPHEKFTKYYRKHALSLFREGISEEVIKFFYGETVYEMFSKCRLWSMVTRAKAQEYALLANSLPIMFAYPDMLYLSMRPKTDMALFRTPLSRHYNNERLLPIHKGKIYIGYEPCVPVTRYSSSLETGLYHASSDKTFCGTFCYVEPESKTYLFGEKILVAETKCQALKYLDPRNKLIGSYLRNFLNRKWEEGHFKIDMMYSPENFKQLGYKGFTPSVGLDEEVYIGSMCWDDPTMEGTCGLYAAEDDFDQALCIEAQKKGFDLVVLTRMIGSHKVVTEVLDTRSRREFLENLLF